MTNGFPKALTHTMLSPMMMLSLVRYCPYLATSNCTYKDCTFPVCLALQMFCQMNYRVCLDSHFEKKKKKNQSQSSIQTCSENQNHSLTSIFATKTTKPQKTHLTKILPTYFSGHHHFHRHQKNPYKKNLFSKNILFMISTTC